MLFGSIRQAAKIGTSISSEVMAVLVPFCFFLGNLGNILYLSLKQQGVPPVPGMLLKLAGIILGAVFHYFLIKRLMASGRPEIAAEAAGDSGAAAEVQGKPHFPVIAVTALNFLAGSSLILSLKFILPSFYMPSNIKDIIVSCILTMLLAFLLEILLILSWKLVNDRAGVKDWFQGFIDIFKLIRMKPGSFTVLYLLTLLSLAAGVILKELSWGFLKNTSLSPILSYFLAGSLISCFSAFLLIFLIKYLIAEFSFINISSGQKKPLAGYMLLAALGLGALYGIFPANTPVTSVIDEKYLQLVTAAENYRNEEKLYLCGGGYKAAYALTQAYQGFLFSLQASKDTDITETTKSELAAKAEQYFRTAYGFWPDSGLIYYLDAMRQLDTNPANSIVLLEKAGILEPDFTDSSFARLMLYKSDNAPDAAAGSIARLVKNGSFSRPSSITNLGIGAINGLIEKYRQYEKQCLENITTSAVFYYENQLYQEAMDELNMLAQVIPDDLAVNYMLAITDLELKADNKPYTVALEASQKILELYPGEEWAEDFATGIAMRAGNQGIMESSLQAAYEKYPGNLDTAEQYAYSILKRNTDFNYTDAARQAEEIVDGVIAKDPSRWFALYCKSVIELFKKEYEGSLSSLEKFSEIISQDSGLHDIYDDFYSLYALKYKDMMLHDARALEVLNTKELTDPFLFNYIYGAFLWRNSDYENSEKYLKSAIALQPGLSKPYFLLGNVYFENAGVFNLPEYYVKAEEQYRKALSIFPGDPYAWFSLGHVLKKTNRPEEALGAFKKTLTHMPAEDHATDHYGISIHSYYQIQEINELLASKEVK